MSDAALIPLPPSPTVSAVEDVALRVPLPRSREASPQRLSARSPSVPRSTSSLSPSTTLHHSFFLLDEDHDEDDEADRSDEDDWADSSTRQSLEADVPTPKASSMPPIVQLVEEQQAERPLIERRSSRFVEDIVVTPLPSTSEKPVVVPTVTIQLAPSPDDTPTPRARRPSVMNKLWRRTSMILRVRTSPSVLSPPSAVPSLAPRTAESESSETEEVPTPSTPVLSPQTSGGVHRRKTLMSRFASRRSPSAPVRRATAPPPLNTDVVSVGSGGSLSPTSPRKMLSPTIHTGGSIWAETREIMDEESRRLSEVAFM